ncbi:VOC family protein [Enemella sp. A6]|uniref:VOC family protein n=1 Tax=Enemella sp. A6 TaxID=3440152 RepID=UPI003EBF0037
MRFDHLSYAAGPEGLAAAAAMLSEQLGVDTIDGGFHPRFGTRNRLIPFRDNKYLEIVEVLEHPVADKAPFGQVVRARSEAGGGWLSWAVSVSDIAPFESRLGRKAVQGSRQFPDGRRLEWRQLGVKGTQADPQLPFFLQWVSEPELQPSALPGELDLVRLEIGGDRDRLEEWLGGDVDELLNGEPMIEWTAPHGLPGIVAVHFNTPRGMIRL